MHVSPLPGGVRLVCEAGMVPNNKEEACGNGGRHQADSLTAAKALGGGKGQGPCVAARAWAGRVWQWLGNGCPLNDDGNTFHLTAGMRAALPDEELP